MSGLRQAALVLHGLAPADRQWMLAQLPRERADDLRTLLIELQEIGLAADPSLIEQAIGDGPGDAGSLEGDPCAAVLAAADADEMHDLLCNEPDRLVAIVLSSSAWLWREAALTRLGPARAARMRDMADDPPVGAALRAAVLDTVAARLTPARSAPARNTHRPGVRRPRRWMQWWSAWTR